LAIWICWANRPIRPPSTILEKRRVLADPLPGGNRQCLKGTKRIIVRQGNVYIGKGRKDDRSIVVIPATSEDPTDGSRIRYLLLLNIAFKESISLEKKVKALGGKYEHIKNIVQENSIPWDDSYLNQVAVDDLFGRSAEKTGRRHGGALWLRMEVGRLNTRKSLAD
jgi:glucosamine--fructose-6-phosphate aminotransferase (isomerizing)